MKGRRAPQTLGPPSESRLATNEVSCTTPAAKPFAPKNPATYQAAIDKDKGPQVAEVAEGAAMVETYTVMHDRKGPSYAILFGRLGDGRRFIANTPDDPKLLQQMVDHDMIGEAGRVRHDSGRNIFAPG